MDLIVQKVTELGVKSITPIKTQRSIVQNSRKSDRWKKIAIESCKQCGRSYPTNINEFIHFSDISKKLANLMDGDLTFDSKEAHGSRFYFSIPLSADEAMYFDATTNQTSVDSEPHSIAGMKILCKIEIQIIRQSLNTLNPVLQEQKKI